MNKTILFKLIYLETGSYVNALNGSFSTCIKKNMSRILWSGMRQWKMGWWVFRQVEGCRELLERSL